MPKASREVGNGKGVSAPQPIRGSGERREFPSRVRGGAPAESDF